MIRKIIKRFIWSSALLVVSMVITIEAHAALFSAGGLDPAFCKLETVRQTVIYIDDMMMVDGKTEWALKISEKLQASLMPGERVTVVRLSPANAQITELWSGCWPNYSAEQRAAFAKQTYLFSQNPIEALGDQQKLFLQGLSRAFGKVYLDAKRSESDVRFNTNNPPQKQILRALASDEGRFTTSTTTVRVIIYSNMMENSDLGTVFKPLPDKSPNYAAKLGSHLRQGVFYAFGVGEYLVDGQAVQETSKAFWSSAIKMMSATLAGFGSDLTVSNRIPTKLYKYDTDLKFNGTDLDGKISILVDQDGNLVDSWIGFTRMTIAGLDGTLRCQNDNCKLDGTTSGGVVTNSPTETVTLTGKNPELSGQLGVKGTVNMFPLTAQQEH